MSAVRMMSAVRILFAAALALACARPALASSHPGRQAKTTARALALAEAVARVGQWDMAGRMYREAVAADPLAAAAWSGLGQALVEDGHPTDALAALDRAQALAPARAGLARLRGRATLALGRIADAEQAFAAATAETPADPRGWVGLGVARDLAGHHAEARAAYARALATDPLDVPARNDLALSLALDGRLAEAASGLRPLAGSGDAAARVRANLALVEAAARLSPTLPARR